MITPGTVLTFQKRANVQSVGDGAVILLADSGQLYTGNSTMDAILRCIDGRRTITELAAALQDEFDVTLDTAVADVIQMAEMLVEEGVVRSIGQNKPQESGQDR